MASAGRSRRSPWPKIFMPTMPFPWVRIHMGADRIETNEIDIDPRRGGSSAQGLKAVAGDAVGSNNALLLGFGEDVHDTAIPRSPVPLGDAVDEDNVDMVDAQLSPETVKVGTDAGRISSVGLGEDGDLVARELLQGCGDVRMAAIRVRRIEEAQTIFVEAVEEKVGERRGAQPGLVGAAPEADCAGSHGQAAGTNAGMPEDHFILSGELLRQRIWVEQGGSSNGGFGEKGCTQGPGGSAKEVSPQHGAGLLSRYDTPIRGEAKATADAEALRSA
jgi:hypothetical protein